MTRETKIGLLVGLAFIIVIGILLSDYNRVEPPQAALSNVAPSVRDGVATPIAESSAAAPALVQSPIVPHQPVLMQQEVTPAPEPVVRVGPGQAVRSTVAVTPPASPAPEPRRDLSETFASGMTPPAHPENRLEDVAREHNEAIIPTAGSPDRAQAPEPAVTASKEYKAQPGDTLSRLAAKLMGANTKANRDAIVKANPTLQQDQNHWLVVGRTYTIPAAASAPIPASPAAAAPVAPPTPAAAAPAPAAAPSPAGTWYTVKENDNLWKIADEQLGDGTAWVALRDLNKDVLKGGDVVRTNMRLKLPAKPLASAN